MQLHWTIQAFDELSPRSLYAILQLRNEVFVVEQNCAYQDADNKDLKSLHLAGWDQEKLVAYARIIPPGISYDEASIGRVVSSPAYRGTGAGKELMNRAIEHCCSTFNCSSIKIGAQLYLRNFYGSLGFIPCSEEYLEDGIPHIEMLFKK